MGQMFGKGFLQCLRHSLRYMVALPSFKCLFKNGGASLSRVGIGFAKIRIECPRNLYRMCIVP